MNKSAVAGFLLGLAGFIVLVAGFMAWRQFTAPEAPAPPTVTRPAPPAPAPAPAPTPPPPAPVRDIPATMTLKREMPGGGAYTPGQTLDITVTLNADGTDPIRAMGLIEDLPPGFTFAGVVGGDHPDLSPPRGREDKLEFAWFNIPTFPTTFTYRVNVPQEADGVLNISGETLFRTTGPELRSPVEKSAINRAAPGEAPAPAEEKTLETSAPEESPGEAVPPNLNVSRSVLEGYAPGETLEIQVTLGYSSSEAVTAMALVETLPPGWTFGEVTGGARPAVVPRSGADGEINFVWVNVPSWPATMHYSINAPANQTGSCFITGYAVYRASGPELNSEPAVTELLPKAE